MRDAERLTVELAATLVAEQFPQWAELDIELVMPGGHDNRTFRLGHELTIRLPTDEGYIHGELKEHEWLARLAPVLPLPIPEVVGAGHPSATFGRPWSIRRWIPGDTATWERIADPVDFARDLAGFLVALRSADTEGAPEAGAQSFYRGTNPSSYDKDTRSTIAKIAGELDVARVTSVWECALASEWTHPPVWFHRRHRTGKSDRGGRSPRRRHRLRYQRNRRPGVRHGHRLDPPHRNGAGRLS